MQSAPPDSLWERMRYGPLMAYASRGLQNGRRVAAIVSRVEYARDANRQRVARDRIRRWLDVSESEARRLYRDALFSEALEEADCARMMRHRGPIDMPVEVRGWEPRGDRPRVYGTLHAGSPVVAFLDFRSRFEPHARIIARELDDQNPMARSKHAFARRKVAWVEETAGEPFFKTDVTSILGARDHLLAGRPLFAAVDVPGDVVDRGRAISLFGERVALAEGLFKLAAMTGADMQLLCTVQRKGSVLVDFRRPVDGPSAESLMEAMAAEMEAAIRSQPEEFWFWPFFAGA